LNRTSFLPLHGAGAVGTRSATGRIPVEAAYGLNDRRLPFAESRGSRQSLHRISNAPAGRRPYGNASATSSGTGSPATVSAMYCFPASM
jgi:hypothetical protein